MVSVSYEFETRKGHFRKIRNIVLDPSAILVLTLAVTMFMALLSVSYKTGFVFYSIWSLTRKNQPKFKVDKSKIGQFLVIVLATFQLNFIYSLLILQSTNDVESILIFSLWNTAVIAYGLSFWMLLKEGK